MIVKTYEDEESLDVPTGTEKQVLEEPHTKCQKKESTLIDPLTSER